MDDRDALRRPVPVDLQHRDQPLRVQFPISLGFLLACLQIDPAGFVLDALEVQGDPDTVTGGRTVIVVENRFRHETAVTPRPRTAPRLPGALGSAGPTLCR